MASEIVTFPLAEPAPSFALKISSLPMVNSALDLAKTYYGATKTRYGVVEKLEKGLMDRIVPQVVEVTSKATPQSAQLALSKGLQQLDRFACSGLDALEKKVPLLKEPAPKVLDSGRRFVDGRLILPVTGLVQGGLLSLDQLADWALELSEQRAETLLPELLAEEEDSPAPKRQKLDKLSRAQSLSLGVTRCLSRRASSRIQGLGGQTSPQELQRLTSADFVRNLTAAAERQVAWLKVSLEAALQQLQKEDTQFRRLLDTHVAELKASLASAVERAEKLTMTTPEAFKESLRAVLEGVSKSIADFVAQVRQASLRSPLNPASVNEPVLKKALETLQTSLTLLQRSSQSVVQLALRGLGEPTILHKGEEGIELKEH